MSVAQTTQPGDRWREGSDAVLRALADPTRRLYAFRPESLDAVRNVLADLWPEALDRLKLVVEQAKSKKQRQTKA
jgi:hypothetical protein